MLAASFLTLHAKSISKTPFTDAVITPIKNPEFPHAFSVTNTGNDTLIIEFIVVDGSDSLTGTPVHLYLDSPLAPQKHRIGGSGALIRYLEPLAPNAKYTLGITFPIRVSGDIITVSVMVKDSKGNRYFLCCNGQNTLF
jgi:hypothetical protein